LQDGFTLGDSPLRFGGLKVSKYNPEGDEVHMSIDLKWNSDSKFGLAITPALLSTMGRFVVGVEDMCLYAKLKIVLKPLIPDLGCGTIGAILVALEGTPSVDFEVKLPPGLEQTIGSALELWLRPFIPKVLDSLLTWPKRILVPLVPPETIVPSKAGDIRFEEYANIYLKQQPTGVVRVKVKEVNGLQYVKKGVLASPTYFVELNTRPARSMRTADYKPDKSGRISFIEGKGAAEESSFDLLVEEADAQKVVVRLMQLSQGVLGPSTVEVDKVEVPVLSAGTDQSSFQLPLPVIGGSVSLDMSYIPLQRKMRTFGDTRFDPTEKGLLELRLVRCEDLRAADLNGTSDPRVKIFVMRGSRTVGKKKSKVIQNTLNPEFNEFFEFVSLEAGDELRLQVDDWDGGAFGKSSYDALGEAKVKLLDAVLAPNGEATKTCALEGKKAKGSITIELKWLPFDFDAAEEEIRRSRRIVAG